MKTRHKVSYYLLLIVMVLLCGAYIGVGVFGADHANAGGGMDIVEPGTDPTVPSVDADLPTIPAEDQSLPGSTVTKIPKKEIPLINYALDLYDKGKGCASTFTYAILNTGNWKGIYAEVNQYAAGNIIRQGDMGIEETFFYWSTNLADVSQLLLDNNLVRTGYRAIITDKSENTAKLIETPKANIDKAASQKTWTYDHDSAKVTNLKLDAAVNRFKAIYCLDFNLEINDETSTVVSIDSDEQYKTIKIRYDVTQIPKEMNDYFHANGSLPPVTYTDYYFTFKISRKSGRLVSLIRDEYFKCQVDNPLLTVSINSHATFTQNFSLMDSAKAVVRQQS